MLKLYIPHFQQPMFSFIGVKADLRHPVHAKTPDGVHAIMHTFPLCAKGEDITLVATSDDVVVFDADENYNLRIRVQTKKQYYEQTAR